MSDGTTQEAEGLADGVLQYTCDVTEEDVTSLRDFMTCRLAVMRDRHPQDSDEYRAAVSIIKTFEIVSSNLLESVTVRDNYQAVRDCLSEIKIEQAVKDIIDDWIPLVYLAEPWKETSGYNTNRWIVPSFGSPKHEAQYEEMKPYLMDLAQGF